MTEHVVTPLRPRAPAPYTDTAALNDIHAVLTTQDPGAAALADIAEIVTRTGRPMVAARDIDTTVTETPLGWPVACAQAGDTSVFVRQQPHGPGRAQDRPGERGPGGRGAVRGAAGQRRPQRGTLCMLAACPGP